MLLVLLSLTLLTGQQCTPTIPGGETLSSASANLAAFDQAWSDFDQYYSYFGYKGIDWDAAYDYYAPYFAEALTPSQFAERFQEVVNELDDWHVWVKAPGTDYLGYQAAYDTNAPTQLIASYAQGGAYTSVGNAIRHARVGNNLAHIVVTTLESGSWQSITDDAIGNIFTQYQDAAGMIIDLRYNSGGNEENAKRIVARLVNEETTYGYTETRNGPDHDDFDPAVAHSLTPSDRLHYNGPIVCLIGQKCMSSAEWFTLMMQRAGATLIGDRTRGASGNPREFGPLSNGVTYAVSTWIAYTADGDIIENAGVYPDIYIAPEESFDATHDYVLEAAVDQLQALP
jgi:hypothetical protein